MNETGVLYEVAKARLMVSCGMTDYGAQCLLGTALVDGIAEDATLRVVLIRRYPDRFEVTDLLKKA